MILKIEKKCLMASSKNAAKDSRIFSKEKLLAGRQEERQTDEDIKVHREMIGVIPVRLLFPCPLEVLKALGYPEDTWVNSFTYMPKHQHTGRVCVKLLIECNMHSSSM